MRARAEVVLDRPVAEVFAFVSDPTNDPQWCPHVRSVKQVAGDGPGVGAVYDVVHDPMGKPADLRYEIRTYESDRRLVMIQDDHLGTFTTTYELSSVDGGRTHLSQASVLRFKGFGRLIAPIVTFFVRRGNRDQFARLEALMAEPTTRGAAD